MARKIYLDADSGTTILENKAIADAKDVLISAGLDAIIGKRPNDHA